MGAGIAFVAAACGFAVDLIEPDVGAQDRAKQRIAKDANRARVPDAPSRIQHYAALPQDTRAVLAIEAVPERLDLKRTVLHELAARIDGQALLATNTSSLSVADIAQGVAGPDRILGLHFFNPPTAMKLVEIVRAQHTSQEAVERARNIVEKMGKVAVVAADTPGFIVNRVARPFYLQAMRAYEAGVAPIEELDRLARGAGFRMGPFELMDLIGIDVNFATSESIYERTDAERLEPVALQRELCAQGRLGRKTGAGFYDYAQGPPVRNEEIEAPAAKADARERIAVLGFAGIAPELREMLSRAYAGVEMWERDEALDDRALDATIVFDVGDGASDRGSVVEKLDAALPPESVIFVDAYATDLDALAKRLAHPERVVGYGIVSSLEDQRVVEIVDAEHTSDDALELAQELFESIGRRVVLVENYAGLFLGRTIASIVNEAMYVVEDDIALAGDVDLAMRLGTNYPRGPLEWGRQIGGNRIARILQRLSQAEGAAFAPHRALWVLDVQDAQDGQDERES